MKNKKQLTYLIIFLAVFLVAILGATYAYFESTTDIGNADFNVQAVTAGSTSFTGYSTGNIEFNVAFSQMSQANVSDSVVATDNAQVSISLESENENIATTCTYDLVWVWDGTDKYTEADTELPYIDIEKIGMTADEIELMKTSLAEQFGISWEEFIEALVISPSIDNTFFKYELSVQVDNGDEIDLSKLTWNGNEAVITRKSITSMAGVKVNHAYDVKVNMYNIPVVQNNLYNKHFNAHIEVRNSNCVSEELEPAIATTFIKAKYTSQGENGMYLHDSALEGGANDGSYRYADVNPNNYVCFEGDDCLEANNQYQIIGVFGDQVKLIKKTSIGYMLWDENGTNTWEGSSLETYLNNDYLTSLGTKANMIANASWHVGGINEEDAKSSNFKGIYDMEINNNTTINRKMGLIYVSDFAYSLPKSRFNDLIISNWDSDPNLDTWIKLSMAYWTITRDSSSENRIFGMLFGLVSTGWSDAAILAHPSFYLTPSVKIKKGTGTSTDPYVIGM